MKLLTKELLEKFREQVDTSHKDPKDIKVIAKFFYPIGTATWYATEYDETDRIFFGFVSLFNDYNDELGSFSLDELEEFHGQFGFGIERDLYFKPGSHTLQQIIDGARP